jgi:uncharacterized protein YbaA (DUF1428 family)
MATEESQNLPVLFHWIQFESLDPVDALAEKVIKMPLDQRKV